MQRWTALLFAVLTTFFVAALFLARADAPAGAKSADAGADAPRDAALDAKAVADAKDAGDPGDAEAPLDEPAPAPSEPTALPTSDAGATLLTGELAPPLPADAPKSVVFGVIIVRYKGAQGAPSSARSREAALELAKQLAVEAKQDFKATLAKGDKGSTENLGRMLRGMLEPAPEYVIFSLPKDGVSDPVDTPTGYWIARRID